MKPRMKSLHFEIMINDLQSPVSHLLLGYITRKRADHWCLFQEVIAQRFLSKNLRAVTEQQLSAPSQNWVYILSQEESGNRVYFSYWTLCECRDKYTYMKNFLKTLTWGNLQLVLLLSTQFITFLLLQWIVLEQILQHVHPKVMLPGHLSARLRHLCFLNWF